MKFAELNQFLPTLPALSDDSEWVSLTLAATESHERWIEELEQQLYNLSSQSNQQ